MPAIREVTRDDLPQVAALMTRANPWNPPADPDDLRHHEDTRDPSLPRLWLAAEEDGRLVAVGRAGPVPWWRRSLITATISVAPERRRQGLGHRLFEPLLAFARDHGNEMASMVSEQSAAGIAFARAHGFTERYVLFESLLDVAAFDERPFAGARERAERAGVTLTTLAAEDAAATRRDVYALWCRIEDDVPSPDPFLVPPFEQWERTLLAGPGANLDAFFLARAGGAYAGLSYMTTPPGRPAYNLLTGTARDHRGMGIALALKLETIRYARAHGIAQIRTNNHTGNAPMLAINERLGYRRQPGRIRFGRAL